MLKGKLNEMVAAALQRMTKERQLSKKALELERELHSLQQVGCQYFLPVQIEFDWHSSTLQAPKLYTSNSEIGNLDVVVISRTGQLSNSF